jgi:hypothetical protein
MTEKRKPRSESLLGEIRELTEKVREVRLELEELVRRPADRTAWRMLSSHGERGMAGDRGGRGRDRARRGAGGARAPGGGLEGLSDEPDLPNPDSDFEPTDDR